MSTDLCVGCIKYSHAVGTRDDNSIPWTHLSAPDLCLLIRSTGSTASDEELIMLVVQGNKTLDTIDVGVLVDRASLARRQTQQAGIMPQIEQLPIFGINKDAVLAFRYRLENQEDRRLQFRLHSAVDCNLIVDTFKRRGMEFQQQRPRTGRPGTGRPDTASSEMRPATVQSTSSYFPAVNPLIKRNPFQSQTLEAGDLSRPQSNAARVPNSVKTTSQEMGPPPFFNRAVALSAQASTVPPPAFQLHRSFTSPSQEPEYRLPSVDRRTSEPAHDDSQPDPRPRANVSVLDSQANLYSITSIQVPPAAQILSLPRISASDGALSAVGPGAPLNRPTVTPLLTETLEHEMPPRREMPFKRPGSQQTTSSRPSTAAQVTPKSKTGQTDSVSPARRSPKSLGKNTSTSRPTTSPLKRSLNAYEEASDSAQPTTSAVQRQEVQWTNQPPAIQTVIPAARTISPTDISRRPSDVSEFIRSHKPLSEKSPNTHKVRRLDSHADAPYEIDTPPRTSSPKDKENQRAIAAASPTSHKTPRTDPTINAVAAVQRGQFDETSLQEYASQSLQDRQAILDEFMIAKLEDPAFTVLCEDVDSCWRRIALGL